MSSILIDQYQAITILGGDALTECETYLLPVRFARVQTGEEVTRLMLVPVGVAEPMSYYVRVELEDVCQ